MFKRSAGARDRSLAALLGLAALVAAIALPLFANPVQRGVEAQGTGYAIRFYGHGSAGIDRIRIPLDAPERPADIGASDFTIDLWLKAAPNANPSPASCNQNDGWITAHTLLDRDIFNAGDFGDFGLALANGRLAFGLSIGSTGTTLCGTTPLDDNAWHHIAVTRDLESGALRLFVDGQPDGSATGPAGDASYRNGRTSAYPNDPFLVLGAEKHDAGPAYPSFNGLLDELRLSTSLRYTAAFSPPSAPFSPDAQTAALYHFDEGPAGACTGTILDSAQATGGPSHGACLYGGSAPAGPLYVSDIPFTSSPPTVTPTALPSVTASTTPATTPSTTSSPIPSNTPTGTLTPTTTPTPTGSGGGEQTPTPTLPSTPTPSLTPAATSDPLKTPTPSATPTATSTGAQTATASATPTTTSTGAAATATPTGSLTPSLTPSRTPTGIPGGTIPGPLPHRTYLPLIIGGLALVLVPGLSLLRRVRHP